jgi:predicted DNA-binding transcriptional regulator AlpA
MSNRISPMLATLAADPERIADVQAGELPGLIGEAEALRARLWARLQAATPAAVAPPAKATEPDRLLAVAEAADRLGVKPRWLYRHAGELPFTHRLPGGRLRFSARGIERWQATRRGVAC